MDLDKAILGRRSIRKFSDKKVGEKEIRVIIESAGWAPSWANTQVWEFVVVRDRSLIEAVTDIYSETNPARSCSKTADAIIVVCAKTGVSGFKNGKPRTKFMEWFMFDTGMAVQNLCLKAHSLGLGTVIVGSMNHDKCNELLKLHDSYTSVCAIPIGYPAEEKSPTSRRNIDETIHYDKF